jgi:hypothetical protein
MDSNISVIYGLHEFEMVQIKVVNFVAQNGDVTSAVQSVLPPSAISQFSTKAALHANAPQFPLSSQTLTKR